MDGLLAFFEPFARGAAALIGDHWRWLLAAALTLLVVGVAAYLLRDRASWLQQGPRRLGAWSLNLMRGLRYLSTRREWRYRTPWTLMVGDPDAGKSSIVASIHSGRRSELLLREAHLAVPDSEWAFFDGGVVIDIRDLDARDPEAIARHWQRVLADIDAQRPERPLDSVILTLSAETLLDPPPGGLQALAERSYRRLFELQKRFSFSFPVYVVVTHCDVVDGFGAFWRAQGDTRRAEIFGWSSPFALSHRFDPDWVEVAFKAVHEDLHAAQLDAAARAEIADPDAFFLFPQRFEALRAPLRTVLEAVFRPATYHDDFLVRGVYFAGRVEAGELAPETPADDVAFVDDLFNERIFRERNLARPTATGVWSRNRLLRRAQVGMLVLLALLLLGLAGTAIRLDAQVDAAIVGFNAIRNPAQVLDTDGACDRGQVDVIYGLLDTLARIDMDWRYPLIPASWMDDGVADGAARQIADRVFSEIVFPSLRCRLELRAQALVTAELGTIAELGDPSREVGDAREQAAAYVDEVLALHEALRNYTFIATNTAGNRATLQVEMFKLFAALAEYAYGETLPDTVQRRQGQPMRALGYITVRAEPRLPTHFRKRVAERLDERLAQARAVIDSRVGDGQALARQVEGEDPSLNIDRLRNWLTFAHRDWLSADRDSNPCALANQAVQPDVERLIRNFGYPATLADGLTRFTRDPADSAAKGCFVDSLLRIQATSVAPYGSVTVRVTDAKGRSHLAIAPWVGAELAGLEALRDQRFMNAPSGDGFRCAAPLRGWDGARLAEAIGYAHEYQQFREQRALAPPQSVDEQRKPLYDQLARRRLHAVLDELVERAQQSLGLADTGTSLWLSPLSTGDERLGGRSRAFALTAPQLQQVVSLYGQFGFDAQTLLSCARGFANGELDAANRLAEASALYEPDTDPEALDPKNGAHRGYFNLGTAAETQEYLQQQLERSQVLAGYAEPFVRFLRNTAQATVNSPDSRKGLSYWLATINEIDRFVQGKDPKSQVALLNEFIQKDLRPMSQSNCADTLLKPASADTDPSQGQGLFAARRGSLMAQSADYCTSGNKVLARGDYRVLAKRFNSELSMLFPFGPRSNADAPLATTKRFFLDYAAQREALRKKIRSAGAGRKWRKVEDFLDQLDAAADFLNASLAAGVRSKPLGLDVGFRYLPASGGPAGGDSQLIAWEFTAGEDTASYPNGSTSLNWQFGQPVSLTLQWAGLSAYRPRADAAQAHLDVSERSASFRADGNWALLRLIEQHRDTAPGVADPLNDHRLITAFEVPLSLNQPPGTDQKATAKLRLALDLLASGADGKPGAPLDLPAHFPRKAPYVW